MCEQYLPAAGYVSAGHMDCKDCAYIKALRAADEHVHPDLAVQPPYRCLLESDRQIKSKTRESKRGGTSNDGGRSVERGGKTGWRKLRKVLQSEF